MPKEPLTLVEQAVLLEAAHAYGTFKDGETGAEVLMERVVLFFLDTGIHPSVLADPHRELRAVDDRGRLYIQWYRPKKKGGKALTRILASSRLRPWVVEFVAQPRPKYRQFYNLMLGTLADYIAAKQGNHHGLAHRNLSPLALRHTFAVNRLNEGMSEVMVQQLMNCSADVLRFYAKFRTEMIDRKLEEAGW